MRKVLVKLHNVNAGILTEKKPGHYLFQYLPEYHGPPISLTMPVRGEAYEYNTFPPFFEGLLPEGAQLEGLLKIYKIDKQDYFQQLVVTGGDLVGAVTVDIIESTNESMSNNI